jgi:hypothetical protein
MLRIGLTSIRAAPRRYSATWDETQQRVSGHASSCYTSLANQTSEFEMLHDDEVIPKYAADIVIGRVKGQEITLEY